MQAVIGARGQEPARLLNRPRLDLNALDRWRTHHCHDIRSINSSRIASLSIVRRVL
jgi:hypothetical protein